MTSQSIQCQSNCKDKTVSANQCSGPLKQPTAMNELLSSSAHTLLMRNCYRAWEFRSKISRSHSMFWFTNWQRRILYNTTLRCYDAMRCPDVCFVFKCNNVWLVMEFDHTQAPKHTIEAMEGRLSVYVFVRFSQFLHILQSIGLETWSPFPSFFHSTMSHRLCGMLLYHDLSPTHWMQQRGGGSMCLHDDVRRLECVSGQYD